MTSMLVPRKDIFFTSFEGGEGILVDLNTKHYYRLNETGALIWKALEARQTVNEIVSQLQSVYDVAAEHATSSVSNLLRALETNKLVTNE